MNQKIIGEYISRKRKEKNMTQAQFAEALNVSNKTISKWENGNSMPDYSIILRVCQALDITLKELLDGRDSDKSEKNAYTDEQVLELLERTRSLEKKVDKLFGIFRYESVKLGLRLMLYLCIFASIDTGLNYMYALIPQDGIANISIMNFLFGDEHGWTLINYFNNFEDTIWFTFIVFMINVVFDYWVKNKR